MRIRIVQKPSAVSVDGIQLDHFVAGQTYEVGPRLGTLFLAEGWAEPAEPAVSDDPVAAVATIQPAVEAVTTPAPANLVREIYPPYYDGPSALAADRRRGRRRTRRSLKD
jgi:hypothetical protein